MVYGHPTINWIPLFLLDLIGTSIYSFPMNMDWWPSRNFLWIKYPTFEDETNMFQHVSTIIFITNNFIVWLAWLLGVNLRW